MQHLQLPALPPIDIRHLPGGGVQLLYVGGGRMRVIYAPDEMEALSQLSEALTVLGNNRRVP